KTTLLLNTLLAAAGGQRWDPLLPEAPARPLRVIYFDGESTEDELKKDVLAMLNAIGGKAIASVNFIPVVEATVKGEPLNLSKDAHLTHVKNFLKHHQPDIVAFDTVSALFTLFNENDNAEVTRKISRPLRELGAVGNCAIIATHHIGKRGENDSEE